KRTAPTLEKESDGAPFLRVITGPVVDRVYQLGLATSIGASPENDIVLADDYVSGMHARIDREGVDYLLRDLKSTNGTIVNDRELTPYVPHTLTPGDVIEVGDTRLEFTMD
ncbi:MAG: FHA domain-containing protein, partial [Anaerolineales bacterium]